LEIAAHQPCETEQRDASGWFRGPESDDRTDAEADKHGQCEPQEATAPNGPGVKPVLANRPQGTEREQGSLADVTGGNSDDERRGETERGPNREQH